MGFLALYVVYILVVVISRIINLRIRKRNEEVVEQQNILDDVNCNEDDSQGGIENCVLSGQENATSNSTRYVTQHRHISENTQHTSNINNSQT